MANVDVKSDSKLKSLPMKAVSAVMGIAVAGGGIPVQNVMAASVDSGSEVDVSSSFIFEQDTSGAGSAPTAVSDDYDSGIITDSSQGLQTETNTGSDDDSNDGITIEQVTPGNSDESDDTSDDGIDIISEDSGSGTSKPKKAPRAAVKYTITYNVNTDDGSVLSGPETQDVTEISGVSGSGSGEILKFSTTVTPANGKKFLGWYDAPTGGNRIYETYKPTGDMTLYAHYTDENTQQVTFSLGCNYGGEKVSFMGEYLAQANGSYEYPSMQGRRGPMDISDPNNIMWKHRYAVNDKKTVTVDTLPEPYIPGYTFKGWYTSDQNSYWTRDKGTEVKAGQEIGTDVTVLYARFSKKLTISFDDLHGGTYPDIVVDTYSSIKDCGVKLPVPDIPGVTLDGWHVSSTPGDGMSIKDDYVFGNLIFNQGYECHDSAIGSVDPLSVCSKPFRDFRALAAHWKYDHGVSASAWADVEFYEETDHITLYPKYAIRRVIFEFDPKGGNFSRTAEANYDLTVYDETEADFKKGFGYQNLSTDGYYGSVEKYIPGHEGKRGWTYSANNCKLPVVSKSNYIFDGWITSDGTKLTEDTWVTANTTFSAKWIPGTCSVMFDPTDGTLTQEERDRVGLDGAWRYRVTTESSVSGSGKQLPIPVSSEGRKFEGWYTKDGEEVTKDTQILKDMTLYAHWGVLPKDLPVTLKFNAGGGTFVDKGSDGTEVNVKSKTITRAEAFGQIPELEDRPGYDFLGWWVVKPNETEPYTSSSFLQQANSSTRVQNAMISDEDEILIVARWAAIEHVSDMIMSDMDWNSVDRDNNQYRIEYNGKDKSTGLGFTATVLSQSVRDEFKNVRWTSSRPDIIYIDGNDTIFSPNYFDSFKFGDNLGDVVLTATSLDNPNVKFDIHVNVYKKEVPDPNPPGTGGSGSGSGTTDPIDPDKPPTSGDGDEDNCNHIQTLTFGVLNQSVKRGESLIRLDISYTPAHVHDLNFVFTSSNPDVVAVSPDGTWWAYGKAKAGSCDITCVAYEDGVEKLRTVTHIDVYESEKYDPTAPLKPGDTINNPLSPQNPMRTVYFVTNGEPMAPIQVQDGMSVTLPVPVRNGYEFKGWYTGDINNDERAEKIDGLAIYPRYDMTLYADWEKLPEIKYFTVNFDPCNGMPAVPVQVQKNAYISSVSFPDISNPGHVLLGWYDAAVGGNLITDDTQIRDDMTIYAHWDQADKKTYTLTLDGNGGMINKQSGSQVLSTYLTEGTNIWSNISAFVPTRDGYTFMGWADEPSGGDMIYDINGHFIEGTKYWKNGMYVGGKNLVVYAQWSRNQKQYTLNFNTREGNYLSPVKYNSDTQANHFPTPTRSGYEFLGWFTHPTNASTGPIDCIRMDEDKTIYAHWKKIDTVEPIKSVTITVDTGVSPIHIQPYVVDEGTRINLPDLTCEGYEFLGWYTEPDAKGTRLLSLVATRDMTVYAGWKKIVKPVPKYQITFDYQDGGTIQVLEREVGEIIEKFPNAIRKGYQFLGWFDQPEGGKRYEAWEDDLTTMFYAHWLKEEDEIPNDKYYTTYFDVMGGELDRTLYHESISVLEGEIVPLPNATRKGYTFDGWYTEPSGGTRVDSLVSSAELTLYAQWTKVNDAGDTYTVMFDYRDAANNDSGTVTAMTLSDDQVLDELPEPDVSNPDDFKGWYDEPTGGKKFTSYTEKNDITLYARWTSDPTQNPPQFSGSDVPEDAKIYHINFVTGAESEGVTIAPLERKAGQIVTGFPTPYRPGYKFLGWYTQSTNGQAVTGFKVEDDEWLYAHWEKIGSTTVVDPDQIDEPKSPTIKPTESGNVLEGTSSHTEFFKYVTYKANETSAKISWKGLRDYLSTKYGYTVTGYEFECSGNIKGNTSFAKNAVSCTITELEPDRSYKASLVVKYTNESGAEGQKTMDIVIPADREGLTGSVNDTVIASSYRLSFDTQVTGLSVADVIYGNGTTVTTFPTVSRDGYTFDGWYTEKNGGVRVEKLVLSSDTILYAHWITGSGSGSGNGSGNSGTTEDPNKKEYTVTFDYQDGTTRTVTERVGTALGTLPDASRAGYTFVGWFTEPAAGMQVTSYQDSKDITFYAHWKVGEDSGTTKPDNPDKPGDDKPTKPTGPAEGQHTLTYNTQGGDLIDPVYVNSGTTIDNFPVPTREGYTFMGWYSAPTGGKKLSGVVVKSDVTIYAQWKQGTGDTVTFSVKVYGNGGKFADGKSVHTWSENSGAVKDPVEVLEGLGLKRTGYKFLGYSYEQNGGDIIKSIAFDSSVKGKSIYAQWQKNSSGSNSGSGSDSNTEDKNNGSTSGTVTDKDLAKYVKFTANATTTEVTWNGLLKYLKSEYGYTIKDFYVGVSDAAVKVEDDGYMVSSDTSCKLTNLDPDRSYTVTFRVTYTDSEGDAGRISTEMKIPSGRGTGDSNDNNSGNNDSNKNLVTKLELSTHELKVTKGDKINLSYKYSPKGADNAEFVWTSSDSSVISVNDGVFKYVGAGKTTLKISTKDGSISDQCEVTVVDNSSGNNGNTNNNQSGNNGSSGSNTNNTGNNGSGGSGGSTGNRNPGGSGSNGSGSNTGSNGSNSGSNGSGNNGSGDSNKPQEIVDYVLTITSTTGTTTRVTVKSNVTVSALAGKLGYTVASYTLRTATSDERVIDGDTSMYAIAELTEKGEVLLIGLDNSGKAIGSAKITRTGDGTYTVIMSKDTNVALKSNSDGSGVNGSGKGDNPGNGTPGTDGDDEPGGNSGTGGEGLRGTDTVDGSPVENKGKSEKAASSVKTGDTNVIPLYGGILGFFAALAAGLFAFTRKKRDDEE